jgi:cytochrome c5
MGGRGAWLMGLAALASIVGPQAVRAAEAAPAAAAPPAADVMRQWSRSCALCHVDGNAGAPRIGHAQEWQPRLAKGSEVLLRHTIEGFNKMPPLGYCMSCEEEDFRALIDFMAGDGE